MRVSERFAPLTAAASALSTMACCLPVGVAAVFGLAGVTTVLMPFQGWLMGVSAVLLALGSLQFWYARRTCQRQSRASQIILITSALIVGTVWFFPQVLAGLMADWLP